MIKYPNNRDKKYNKLIKYGNRGMNLENDINESNAYYLEKDIAIIHKKPTPIGVVKQVANKLLKLILKVRQLLIIMVYMLANILISRPKKLKIKLLFHLITFTHTRLNT